MFALQELTAIAQQALARAGANEVMAAATARALVAAEAQGLSSHGLGRVPQYALHLRNGRADGSAIPAIARAKGATVLVDAKSGLAFPACALAISEAVRVARDCGIAFAGVTNSHHFGVVLSILDWEALAAKFKAAGQAFVIEPHIRFRGLPGEQATMFFLDPFGNALEFKAFADPDRLFAR